MTRRDVLIGTAIFACFVLALWFAVERALTDSRSRRAKEQALPTCANRALEHELTLVRGDLLSCRNELDRLDDKALRREAEE